MEGDEVGISAMEVQRMSECRNWLNLKSPSYIEAGSPEPKRNAAGTGKQIENPGPAARGQSAEAAEHGGVRDSRSCNSIH
ncbi:hypothetical protein Asru_0281_05 [Acidisphaera rubrifaciens HS-AP3]|uniref:Uncharacterized protein n=1 Tax=Acidisphaera rubrifaciens HS-AP3 TaxID=1231350 RepID=A0A0D6P8W5_9PROT|nr:hypothetical protein Asru_0281_05 [Acidisphaera rubrifaciens HS-AP3]